MTVNEMLACHSSTALTELRAYEMKNGPIGSQYEREALAAIHEQLQRLVSTLISVNVEDEDDVPPIVHFPRPHEIFNQEEEE